MKASVFLPRLDNNQSRGTSLKDNTQTNIRSDSANVTHLFSLTMAPRLKNIVDSAPAASIESVSMRKLVGVAVPDWKQSAQSSEGRPCVSGQLRTSECEKMSPPSHFTTCF